MTPGFRDSNCAGFYLWPAVWIGKVPEETGNALTAYVLNALVAQHDLPCGIRLKVSKQGLFVFDFAGWPPGKMPPEPVSLTETENALFARMRFLNLFLVCFYSESYRQGKHVAPKLFIDFRSYLACYSFDLDPYRAVHDERNPMEKAIRFHSEFKPGCQLVSEDSIGAAISVVNNLMQKDPVELPMLAELLLHSWELYENGKYEACHVNAWTIVERSLNEVWEQYLDASSSKPGIKEGEEKFINAERRKKLTGRDFTASIVSECLSLAHELNFELFKSLTQVRQTRNDWLHNLKAIGRNESAAAIVLAQSMLKEARLLEFTIPFQMIVATPLALIEA